MCLRPGIGSYILQSRMGLTAEGIGVSFLGRSVGGLLSIFAEHTDYFNFPKLCSRILAYEVPFLP